MEKILLAYSLPKVIYTTIIMLFKNKNAMVRSFDGDNFFGVFLESRKVKK